MAWGDVLAALVGAGEGELGREERNATRAHEIVIRKMINDGTLNVAGLRGADALERTQITSDQRRDAANATNQTRRDIANQNIELGNRKLSALTSHWGDQNDLGYARLDQQGDLGWTKLAQDDASAQRTDRTRNRIANQSDASRNRIADQSNDLGYYTADARADSNDQARQDRLRVNAARLALQRTKPKPGASSLLTGGAASSPEAEATKYDDEYNRLLRELDDPDAMAALLSDKEASGGAPSVTPSNLFGTLGLQPRRTGAAPAAPAAAAPAPAQPSAPPGGLTVGATVTLKSGKKVTVTKINPDGTFEYK